MHACVDAFRGVYRDYKNRYDATPSAKLPMIHCHCFTKSPEPATDIYEVSSQTLVQMEFISIY